MVVVIIAVIATIAFVTFGRAIRSGRESGERMFLNSLKISVEGFRQDQGFLPPLVNDNLQPVTELRLDVPIDRNSQQPLVRDAAFLRGETNPTAPRWSVFSLPFYLTGVMGAAQDGIDGPGMTRVNDDGTFSRSGRKYDAYFDSAKDPARFRRNPTANLGQTEVVMVDRWGKNTSTTSWFPFLPNTIRYYRWEPRFHPAGTPNAGQPIMLQDGTIASVPKVLRGSVDQVDFKTAGFAIVSKGPDGRIDDNDGAAAANADNLVEVGR